MRLNIVLCQQHLGWMFKKHWQIQGKRVVRDTGASAELEKLGIAVKDVEEVLNPKTIYPRIQFPGNEVPPVVENETHPDWHNDACYMYADNNVLVQGLAQAQLLTKTIEINKFPTNIEESVLKAKLPGNIDTLVQKNIMAAHVYDAEQVKLPVVKLPERPAYKLPRSYGISHKRRNTLLTNKFLNECEKWAARTTTADRWLFSDLQCRTMIDMDKDLVQFNVSIENLIASKRPLESVKSQYKDELPDLYPLKPTISLKKQNIYKTEPHYPLPTEIKILHPHTIITHFINGEVGNLHETQVTDSQFQSRTLLKAFAVAAARAKQLYGNDTKELPKPVMIQSIQTDGRKFHFGVFQLNTLDLSQTDGIKNYWFHETPLKLFQVCGYVNGRPTLESYNKDVFRVFNAFYNSQSNFK